MWSGRWGHESNRSKETARQIRRSSSTWDVKASWCQIMVLDSLYGVAATNDTLPAIVKAVDGRAEVYLDGAVRRGTDVFKALALSTRAVFLGRPILFGLAHSGEDGVAKVLRILNNEMKHAMLVSGTAHLLTLALRMSVVACHHYHRHYERRINLHGIPLQRPCRINSPRDRCVLLSVLHPNQRTRNQSGIIVPVTPSRGFHHSSTVERDYMTIHPAKRTSNNPMGHRFTSLNVSVFHGY
ncbi:hypothetical protein PsorP6_009957 [Peronosclerospora sorghi]|uniref:Uncharacterized protein n=1 Tax=Peronosclerospora sorghi TaxID=230839 RepID=A0ACC0VWS5_9STRA|nr:hypothetical protein PsorP6_009957 [Peronosclerospora sorghi]